MMNVVVPQHDSCVYESRCGTTTFRSASTLATLAVVAVLRRIVALVHLVAVVLCFCTTLVCHALAFQSCCLTTTLSMACMSVVVRQHDSHQGMQQAHDSDEHAHEQGVGHNNDDALIKHESPCQTPCLMSASSNVVALQQVTKQARSARAAPRAGS